MLVQKVITIHLLPNLDRIWPYFVHLLSNEGQAIIGYNDHFI